jgi:hypothetical protein
MFAASDPNFIIAGLAIGGLMLVALWRLVIWVRDAPLKPDPWDNAVEQQLQSPDTPEACPHCSTPQSPGAWFCPHCGSAVGPYNNLMPYVHVFSEGEVFRNGVNGRFRNRTLITIGFFLVTLAINPFFTPVYVLLLLSNLKRPADRRESPDAPAGC